MSPSLPPKLNPALHLIPRNAIPHQLHRNTQLLRLHIAALIVKEEHILVPYPRPLLQRLKVPNLAARVNLDAAVKRLERFARLVAFLVARHVQHLEQVPRERGRARPRRHAQSDLGLRAAVARVRQQRQDARHVCVKGVVLAVPVRRRRVRRVGLERRRDVRVYPKRPQRVVEVEYDELWERQGRVAEGGRQRRAGRRDG